MNTFYKPSAASTFNRSSSGKLVSKTRSFRAKLKSKIMRQPRSTRKQIQRKNSADFSSFNSSDSCSNNCDNNSNKQSNVVVNAFCKIMNKSLSLFKSGKKSSKKSMGYNNNTQEDDDELYPEPAFAVSLTYFDNETQCSISIDQFNQSDYFLHEMNAINCCISTPKKANSYNQQQMYQVESFSVLDHEEVPIHSTPDRKNVLSPIFVPLATINTMSSQENSYLSSSSSRCSASLISDNQFRSFGMTSSPMSLKSNSIRTDPNSSMSDLHSSSVSCTNDIENFKQIFFASSQPMPVIMQRHEDEIDREQQQKLIRHLNNIKRNVRMSVELRNVQTSSKRDLYELNNMVTMSSKKRRLQNMFRSKIHRQLKEIKTWRIGFRNKLELSNVNDLHYQYCDCFNCNQNQLNY